MAKLPALISALAACDSRDHATIEHIARVVREAGYIPTTKRGSGASDMSAREAVNLFLGANGCDAPKDAPLAIDRFRSLRLQYSEPREPMFEVFKAIAGAENFGVALEHLVEGMDQIIALARQFFDQGYPPHIATRHKASLSKLNWNSTLTGFALRISLRRYAADIVCETYVGTSIHDAHWRQEFLAKFIVDGERLVNLFYGTDESDREVTVNITGRTFLHLWLALNGDQEPGGEADDQAGE
jgi:hypothetical protein